MRGGAFSQEKWEEIVLEVFIEALPAFGEAWALILQPIVLGYLVLGVLMGLCIGVFPGLGGIAGL